MRIILSIALALAPLGLAGLAEAGRFNDVLSVGDQAPVWENLQGVDGRRHALSDYEAPYLVQVFTCNFCPCAKACEDRIKAIQRDFGKRGAQVVAINIGQTPYDELEKMRERSKEEEFNFPYLRDASQQTGRDYGASVTPHVFVLGPDRRVAYMGALDDNVNDAKSVKKPYLRNALEAFLAAGEPRLTETRQSGCPIEYRDEE